jgi:hypothetical protein
LTFPVEPGKRGARMPSLQDGVEVWAAIGVWLVMVWLLHWRKEK